MSIAKACESAISEKSAYDLFLTRNLKSARLMRAPGADASVTLFTAQKMEALAGLKPALLAAAEKIPGSRVLEGRFTVVQQAVGTPKARDAGAKYLREFVEDVKASGFVGRAIEKNGIRGVVVAPKGQLAGKRWAPAGSVGKRMKKGLLIGLAVAGLWSLTARAQNAESAKAALDRAAATLGAASLGSIQFSGTGSDYQFGQGYDGNAPWPRFGLPRFVITIDYTIPAFLDERTRVQVENPPLGGGFQPLVGELRQIWALSGKYAWDVAGGNPVPAAPDRDLRSAVDTRLAQIWMTPQGFVKAAMAGNATAKTQTVRGARKTVISFTAPNKAVFEGVLDEQGLVERIETRFDNAVLGDTLFEAVLTDYKDFGGVKFPTRIVQREGGYPVLDLAIADVRPNIAASIEVPASMRQAPPSAPPPDDG